MIAVASGRCLFGSDKVLAYCRRQHDRPADWAEGDIGERVLEFGSYELCRLDPEMLTHGLSMRSGSPI